MQNPERNNKSFLDGDSDMDFDQPDNEIQHIDRRNSACCCCWLCARAACVPIGTFYGGKDRR